MTEFSSLLEFEHTEQGSVVFWFKKPEGYVDGKPLNVVFSFVSCPPELAEQLGADIIDCARRAREGAKPRA